MNRILGPLVFVALGLVLALAVPGELFGIQVHTIGWIITGIAALAAVLIFFAANSKTRSATLQSVDPATGSQRTETVSDAGKLDPTL